MSIENVSDRLNAGWKVVIGKAEAVTRDDLEQLKQRSERQESREAYEARMRWMETPFLVVQVRGNENQQALTRYINPKIHSAFNPAIKVEIRSDKLVGRRMPLEFLINSDSLEKVISLPASHVLKKGPNIIMPRIAIKTDAFAEGRYSVSIAIPAGFILNSITFPISRQQDASEELNDVLDKGMTLQDLVDLLDQD